MTPKLSQDIKFKNALISKFWVKIIQNKVDFELQFMLIYVNL